MDRNDKYFSSANLYLSAFLFAKGLELVNCDKTTDPQKAQFIFIDSPLREQYIAAYNFGLKDDSQVKIDARILIAAIRQLKNMVHQ